MNMITPCGAIWEVGYCTKGMLPSNWVRQEELAGKARFPGEFVSLDVRHIGRPPPGPGGCHSLVPQARIRAQRQNLARTSPSTFRGMDTYDCNEQRWVQSRR